MTTMTDRSRTCRPVSDRTRSTLKLCASRLRVREPHGTGYRSLSAVLRWIEVVTLSLRSELSRVLFHVPLAIGGFGSSVVERSLSAEINATVALCVDADLNLSPEKLRRYRLRWQESVCPMPQELFQTKPKPFFNVKPGDKLPKRIPSERGEPT